MGERPKGLSIERIDNNGHYELRNCKWATRKEQQRNTRTNRRYTVLGISGCVTELCEKFALPVSTVITRIERGWPLHKAFTCPKLCSQHARA